MFNQVTNCANITFFVGQKVKHNDGWIGTIHKINTDSRIVKLHVTPDKLEEVPAYQRWKLNPEAAKMAGMENFCEPRDNGQSMGNFTPLK